MKFPAQFKCWIAIFAFIVGFSTIYERNNPDEFLFPFKTRKYPEQFTIPFTTLFQQPDHITCGPTSAVMVLKAYGKDVTLDTVKKITKTVWFQYNQEDVGMTTPDYLVLAMNHYGVESKMMQGNIHLLKYQISHNKPCIVLVRSGEQTWHYFVVIGYDPEYLYVADPGDGNIRPMATKIFLECWNWTADTNGELCQQSYLITLLNMAEVYPNTIIFPKYGATHEPESEIVFMSDVGS